MIPREHATKQRLSGTSVTRLPDLDIDSLAEICEYLDVPAQFSLYRTSRTLAEKILQGKWHVYYRNGFDMVTVETQTETEQLECLAIILKNFSKIRNVPLEIFKEYIKTMELPALLQIEALGIYGRGWAKMENKYLEFKEFRRFSSLQDLRLTHVYLDFNDKECRLPLKTLHIQNVSVLNDLEGDFLSYVFTKDLRKLTITSMYSGISLQKFPEIVKCGQLKELTLSTHIFYYPETLDALLHLNTLELITLESYDKFGFTVQDNFVFASVLTKCFEDPSSHLKELSIRGFPEDLYILQRNLSHNQKLYIHFETGKYRTYSKICYQTCR